MDLSTLHTVFSLLGSKVSSGGSKLRVTCPLSWNHSGGRDENPSMVVFPAGKHGDPICACSSCHWKGSVWKLLSIIESRGVNVDESKRLIGGTVKKKTKDDERREIVSKVRALTHDEVRARRVRREGVWVDRHAIALADKVSALDEREYERFRGSVPRYALDRGLLLETCRAWDLGHNAYGRRLTFPVRDHLGRLVAVSGRLYACPACGWKWPPMGKQPKTCGSCGKRLPPKFLHSPKGFKRDMVLYGENRKSVDIGWLVYVVEGNLDAPMIWQMGYRPVVATLGSNVSAVQVEKLVAWWDHILIVQDADKSGDGMVQLVKKMVAGRKKVTSVRPPDGVDPCGLSVEKARELLGDPPYESLVRVVDSE